MRFIQKEKNMFKIGVKGQQQMEEETKRLHEFIKSERKRGNNVDYIRQEVCPEYVKTKSGKKIDISDLTTKDLFAIITTYSVEDSGVWYLTGDAAEAQNIKETNTEMLSGSGVWQTKEKALKQFEIKDWKTLNYFIDIRYGKHGEDKIMKEAAKFILKNYSSTLLSTAQAIWEYESGVKGENVTLRDIARDMEKLEQTKKSGTNITA